MTNKIYRSAMGTPIDMGALALQNENTRAVGNMNVNARGDKLDSNNRVVETRTQSVQKQYKKATIDPSRTVPHKSTLHAQREKLEKENKSTITPVELSTIDDVIDATDTFNDLPDDNEVIVEKDTAPVEAADEKESLRGGLAGAIARSREVRQEKEKTLRELKQDRGPKKI